MKCTQPHAFQEGKNHYLRCISTILSRHAYFPVHRQGCSGVSECYVCILHTDGLVCVWVVTKISVSVCRPLDTDSYEYGVSVGSCCILVNLVCVCTQTVWCILVPCCMCV